MKAFVKRLPGAFKDALKNTNTRIGMVIITAVWARSRFTEPPMDYNVLALRIAATIGCWVVFMALVHHPEAYAQRINNQEK